MSNFHKLTSNLDFGLNNYLDDILKKITYEFSNDKNSYEVFVWDGPDHIAYWQHYPYSNTRFTRNFGRGFSKLSKYVIARLTDLQKTVQKEQFSDVKMYEAFINHKFNHEAVQLSKIIAGEGASPHIDNGREYVINIGIRNSNTCKVYISDNQNTKNFNNKNLESFVLEDNDVYILNVNKAHAVKTLVNKDSNLDRYILTYMLTEC